MERRLTLYARALWGRAPQLVPFPARGADGKVGRAAIVGRTIRLPDVVGGEEGCDGATVYRAAVAHAMCHLVHSTHRLAVGSLRPVQLALVALLEDARVERLASRDMPGLARLWLPFHTAVPADGGTPPALLARLARALLDPDYEDGDAFVAKGRHLFLERTASMDDPQTCRTIGMLLGNDLGQMRVQFDFRSYRVEPSYRDDNAFLWDAPAEAETTSFGQAFFREAVELTIEKGRPPAEIDVEKQGGPREERVAAELSAPPPETGSASRQESFAYDEWDEGIGAFRAAWCTLHERPVERGDSATIHGVLARHHETVAHLTRTLRSVHLLRPTRLPRRVDGDRLDLDACVAAAIDLRVARTPDPHVHQQLDRERRDVAAVLLLDLSASMDERVADSRTSVLDLAREATVLIANAMDRLGDTFAIHGFDSDGRHLVEYHRLKDFDEPCGDVTWGRIAAMRARFSTRMGTVLRHAGRFLAARRATHKLILVLSDGRPHDVDVFDDRYLVFDAKHAVAEQRSRGIRTFCLSVDPAADAYVARIFGLRHYEVLEDVRRLASKLPFLYLRLTT